MDQYHSCQMTAQSIVDSLTLVTCASPSRIAKVSTAADKCIERGCGMLRLACQVRGSESDRSVSLNRDFNEARHLCLFVQSR